MTDHAQQQLANGDMDCETCGHRHARIPEYPSASHSDPYWCIARLGEQLDAAVDLARAHEAEAWKCRQEMTDMTAQNGVLLAEVKRLESELAALRAKLPTYVSGEAFVPGVDEFYFYFAGKPRRVAPDDHNAWAVARSGHRCYPTAAECGEAEGKSVIAYAKADHIAAGQAVTKRLRDDGTAATPRGEEVG